MEVRGRTRKRSHTRSVLSLYSFSGNSTIATVFFFPIRKQLKIKRREEKREKVWGVQETSFALLERVYYIIKHDRFTVSTREKEDKEKENK